MACGVCNSFCGNRNATTASFGAFFIQGISDIIGKLFLHQPPTPFFVVFFIINFSIPKTISVLFTFFSRQIVPWYARDLFNTATGDKLPFKSTEGRTYIVDLNKGLTMACIHGENWGSFIEENGMREGDMI